MMLKYIIIYIPENIFVFFFFNLRETYTWKSLFIKIVIFLLLKKEPEQYATC